MPRKRDIRQIEAVAAEFSMTPLQRREYGDYVEDCKRAGEAGTAGGGNYTYDELRQKAREYLGDDDG